MQSRQNQNAQPAKNISTLPTTNEQQQQQPTPHARGAATATIMASRDDSERSSATTQPTTRQHQQLSRQPGTSADSSRYAKLDGVLYHFYAKTSAVVANCRLSHYDDGEQQSSTDPSSTAGGASGSRTGTRRTTAGKWVSLQDVERGNRK